MFLTGFVFGSLVVYLICLEEEVLPMWANTSIAISAGILFGLITLLVQYVGLFMLGFHGGLILVRKMIIKKLPLKYRIGCSVILAIFGMPVTDRVLYLILIAFLSSHI